MATWCLVSKCYTKVVRQQRPHREGYLSQESLGTPVSRPHTGEGLEEEQVKINFSAVDKTVLVPRGRSRAESTATPIKFTEELQNGAALRVRPQGWSLPRTLVF